MAVGDSNSDRVEIIFCRPICYGAAIQMSYGLGYANFTVHVLSDCVTSYDLKKLPEMLAYYESKGCEVKKLVEYK